MVLVIGYGNPLCSDDGVGPTVIDRLEEWLTSNTTNHLAQNISPLSCHQLSPELTESVSQADSVIFIDAEVGDQPGVIRSYRLANLADSDYAGGVAAASAFACGLPFSHRCSPQDLLSGARLLYGKAPQALLITVAGASFDYGTGLTPAVLDAVPTIIRMIQDEVNAVSAGSIIS